MRIISISGDTRRGALFVVALVLIAASSPTSYAQLPAAPHEVLTAVRNSKVVPDGSDVRATISGRSVIVTKYQDSKISDKNCKIDAAIITKSITDSFPDVVAVRLLFYDKGNPFMYRCVDVQKSLIEQFGKGKIADTVMIDALTVVSGRVSVPKKQQISSLDTYIPIPGMALEERTANLMYIRKLKRLGGNADGFFQRFMTIEKDYVGQGRLEGYVKELNSLNADLVTALGSAEQRAATSSPGDAGPRRGVLYDRRRAVYARLEQLGREGKDVRDMKRIFNESVEAKVGRSGADADIDQSLTLLENRLRFMH